MFFYLNRLSSLKDDQLRRLMQNFEALEDLLNGKITADNIALLAITAALIANDTVTPAKISGNPQTTSGTYAGDGAPNRVIALGFTPRYAWVVRVSNGDVFEAVGDGTTRLTQFWRIAAGTQSSGDTDWQGVTTNGFKLGSAAGGGRSNANTETYYFHAYR